MSYLMGALQFPVTPRWDEMGRVPDEERAGPNQTLHSRNHYQFHPPTQRRPQRRRTMARGSSSVIESSYLENVAHLPQTQRPPAGALPGRKNSASTTTSFGHGISSSSSSQPSTSRLDVHGSANMNLNLIAGQSDMSLGLGTASRKRGESKSSTSHQTPPLPTNADTLNQPSSSKAAFVETNGHRHHTLGVKVAPYPLSYDRIVTDLDYWDHAYFSDMKKSVSFVRYEGKPKPLKCLDLGCGTGAWILQAAVEWPETHFVGFDLVPLHPPDCALVRLKNVVDIQERIEWMTGNFLNHRLPFKANTFDHIHVRGIAKGVPEKVWDKLFGELHRVMTPGGVLEMMEEDIIFPKIAPPWDPLLINPSHPHLLLNSSGNGNSTDLDLDTPFPQDLSTRATAGANAHKDSDAQSEVHGGFMSQAMDENPTIHPHALIEYLYERLFVERWINMRPTSILANYFNTYLQQVTCPPAVNFPLPPPPEENKPHLREYTRVKGPFPSSSTTNEGGRTSGSTSLFYPNPNPVPPPMPLPVVMPTPVTTRDRSQSVNLPARRPPLMTTPVMGLGTLEEGTSDVVVTRKNRSHTDPTIPPAPPPAVANPSPEMGAERRRPYLTTKTSVRAQPSAVPSASPTFALEDITDPALCMHMHRSFQNVLACREAMWVELDRLRPHMQLPMEEKTPPKVEEMNGQEWKDMFRGLGWVEGPGGEEVAAARGKFDETMDRFAQHMHARCALNRTLKSKLAWDPPFKDPPSAKDMKRIVDEREHAAQYGLLEPPAYDESAASRSVRLFIGYKERETEGDEESVG